MGFVWHCEPSKCSIQFMWNTFAKHCVHICHWPLLFSILLSFCRCVFVLLLNANSWSHQFPLSPKYHWIKGEEVKMSRNERDELEGERWIPKKWTCKCTKFAIQLHHVWWYRSLVGWCAGQYSIQSMFEFDVRTHPGCFIFDASALSPLMHNNEPLYEHVCMCVFMVTHGISA